MSRHYMTDGEKKGYEAWDDRFHGKSYYDGDYEYQNGWEMHRREEAEKLEREDEQRQLEEEQERQERRRARERELDEEIQMEQDNLNES